MNSDLSINQVITQYRHCWWLAVVLAVIGLLAGFLAARMPRYQTVITDWSIPVVVRDQPLSRVDEGYSEALYASMLFWLQEEWQTNIGDQAIDVTVRLNRQTYHLMTEDNTSGFGEEAAQTFENFSGWITGDRMPEESGVVDSEGCLNDIDNDSLGLCPIEGHEIPPSEEQNGGFTNSLHEIVWLGEMSGPTVIEKHPHAQWVLPLVGLISGLLVFLIVMLMDVSCRKPVKTP